MLQIYIISSNESGFLDISPGTSLDIESLSDAFDEDLGFGEFSLPVDLPFTEKNRRLLHFAERISNNIKTKPFFTVNVYDDGFPELLNAKMTLLSSAGILNASTGKFSVSISGTKGLFGSLIFNKKLTDLHFEAITFTETSSRDFATAVMKGTHPAYGYMAFAPVAIENYFDTSRPDYINEFLALDTVNTVVITGSAPDNWEFGRPQSTNPNLSAVPGTSEFIDFRTIPFFSFKYVLQKLFNEFGYTASGALISDSTFNDLYVYNTWSIDNLNAATHVDSNRNIFPANHLPGMLISDALKAIFSFFKVYPVFNGNKVSLKYKTDLLVNRLPVSIAKYCSPEFETSFKDDTEDGYTIDYNWDSNDSYYSDRVKDLKDVTVVATVAKKTDLNTLNIGRPFTTDDVALVQAENLYYRVADATSTPVLWDCYAENLGAYIKDGGERTADAGLSTLCQYAANDTSGLYERQNYVGARQAGNYINNKGVRVTNPFGLRLFYIKKYPAGTVNIPQSFNHNTMPDGNLVELYSLALNAISNGFAKKFHTAWEDLKTNLQTVKFELATNKKALNLFKDAECIEVNSVQYINYKTERSLPAQQTQDVYLVPL